MQIRLLGAFAVDVNGHDVAAGPWRLRKSRSVLKVLALAADQRMQRDRLLELLWPDRSATAAANNLHQALHVARRAVLGSGQDQGLLVIRDGLVVLHADGPVGTDVIRFRRLAARAWATRDVHDFAAAVAAYTGELLPGDRFEEWTTRPRNDLRQAFCDLLVAQAAACAAVWQVGAALESLRRAVEADPLHESAVRAYMRLLAEQGRRSEALALYERLRQDLTETYGSDPDPDSRRLYRDLLAGSVDTTTSRPLSARSNIQPALTSFVGRERQIADVHRELSRARLVTLTGPGGVGKTRLAEEALRGLVDKFRDGVWMVDLVPVRTGDRLPDAVAEAIGLDPAAGTDPMRALVGRLVTRHLLLLLDNCEHLVAPCADLVRSLIRRCPELRVLTTSREPLHVPGEVAMRVPSLAVPSRIEQLGGALSHEAVRLLVDRARDVRSDFRLDESNLAAVVEICRRLDGVPLAIELAAARLAHLEPAEVAERLSDALTVLGGRDRMTRNATLRAALEWSHGLLTDDEQVLLRRLSVFGGSFSLRAVEGVCAASPLAHSMILDCLGRLVDKSMVQVERSSGRSRYRLLDTIRQFGQERLVAAGERSAVEAAHCGYFLKLAEDHDLDRQTVETVHPQLLDEEQDNLRSALGRALRTSPDEALRLAASLWRFWLARGHFAEGSAWLEQTLAVASPATMERSRALLALALLEARQGHTSRFTELGAAAVAVMDTVGSPVDVAFTRLQAGFFQPLTGNLQAAAETAAQGLVQAERLGSPGIGAAAHWLLSLVELFRENGPTALARLHDTLTAVQKVDQDASSFLPAVTMAIVLIPCAGRWVPAFEETALIGSQVARAQAPGYVWSEIGTAYRLQRDLGSAAAAVRRAAGIFDGIADDAGSALALHQLGCIERDRGEFDSARVHLNTALRLRRRLGDRRGENLTLANLGLTDAAAGDVENGRRLARTAVARGEEVDDGPGVAGSLLDLAVVELSSGDLSLGRRLAEQAADAFRPQGYPRLTAWALQFAAELAMDDGAHRAARRQGAEAAALFSDAGCRIGRSRAVALAAQTAKAG
jgi:predicted ATPase/DNA-binding SARP family transcriptional activator